MPIISHAPITPKELQTCQKRELDIEKYITSQKLNPKDVIWLLKCLYEAFQNVPEIQMHRPEWLERVLRDEVEGEALGRNAGGNNVFVQQHLGLDRGNGNVGEGMVIGEGLNGYHGNVYQGNGGFQPMNNGLTNGEGLVYDAMMGASGYETEENLAEMINSWDDSKFSEFMVDPELTNGEGSSGERVHADPNRQLLVQNGFEGHHGQMNGHHLGFNNNGNYNGQHDLKGLNIQHQPSPPQSSVFNSQQQSPIFNHAQLHSASTTQPNQPNPRLILPLQPEPTRPTHELAWLSQLRSFKLTPADTEWLVGHILRLLLPLPIFDEDIITTHQLTPDLPDTDLLFSTTLKEPGQRLMGGGKSSIPSISAGASSADLLSCNPLQSRRGKKKNSIQKAIISGASDGSGTVTPGSGEWGDSEADLQSYMESLTKANSTSIYAVLRFYLELFRKLERGTHFPRGPDGGRYSWGMCEELLRVGGWSVQDRRARIFDAERPTHLLPQIANLLGCLWIISDLVQLIEGECSLPPPHLSTAFTDIYPPSTIAAFSTLREIRHTIIRYFHNMGILSPTHNNGGAAGGTNSNGFGGRWESVDCGDWCFDEDKMMEVFKAVYGADLWWAEVWEWAVGCYGVVHGDMGVEWIWFGP